MTTIQVLEAAAIGLAAGLIGGLAGVGGSLVMIPGLALVFGYADESHREQHLYMAAAMAVNVLVSIPATLRHIRAGAVRRELTMRLMPPMIAAIIVGVLISDRVNGAILKQLLALFIAGYCTLSIYRVFRPRQEANRPPERIGPARIGAIGGFAGLCAGLLGIGGGGIIVPALQVFSNVRLRHAIGASSAVMVVTATIGASLKLGTLRLHAFTIREALALILALAPGAIIGGWLGAHLAHHLPLRIVRLVVSILLIMIAVRLA